MIGLATPPSWLKLITAAPAVVTVVPLAPVTAITSVLLVPRSKHRLLAPTAPVMLRLPQVKVPITPSIRLMPAVLFSATAPPIVPVPAR